jgi:hypothetical protein
MLHVARVNLENVSAPPTRLVKSSRVAHPNQRGARVCPRGDGFACRLLSAI